MIISDELLGASEPHNIVRFLATGDNNGDPYTSAIIVATVSGVLFFQAIFRKLDSWVEGKRHAKEVLAYMFRELVSPPYRRLYTSSLYYNSVSAC